MRPSQSQHHTADPTAMHPLLNTLSLHATSLQLSFTTLSFCLEIPSFLQFSSKVTPWGCDSPSPFPARLLSSTKSHPISILPGTQCGHSEVHWKERHEDPSNRSATSMWALRLKGGWTLICPHFYVSLPTSARTVPTSFWGKSPVSSTMNTKAP